MNTIRYDKIAETLVTHTLPNGLKISIVPRPEFKKCFSMFATNYGGADRRFKLGGKWIDTPAGVAHFLEHKMFDMPTGNVLAELSANGASPNAFTSSGLTAYHFESTDMFYENLKLLLDYVSTPYFTAESVAKEQGIIGQEIRMVEDNPEYVMYYNLLRCLYAHNPLRDSVAGTIESIAQITDQTLHDCHKVFYNPSNMALAVVGNVDPEKVIEMAQSLLPTEQGEVPERDYGEVETGIPQSKTTSVKMEVSAPQFLLGTAIAPEKDGKARLRQLLTGEIALRLLLGRSSPLYTGLYADGLITGSFDYEFDFTAGAAMAIAAGESRDVDALMERLIGYARTLAENGPDEGLFGRAKKAEFGVALRTAGSFSTLSQALVAGSFAGYCPFDSLDVINDISIDELTQFISENFTEEKLALSVVYPRD